MSATSLLFAPGSMPGRFDKAVATGADLVCLDLEDSIAPEAKARARGDVLAYVATHAAPERLCIRINRLGSVDGLEDAVALARASARPGAVMLPKVESPRDTELWGSIFATGGPTVIALVESPRGVEASFDIAASSAVAMLMFGSFDYAAEASCTQDWDVLLPVRSRLVAAAAAAGKSAIDSPYADLTDAAGGAAESRRARAMGFAGKAAIHPRMLDGIVSAFTPTAEQIAEARAILTAFDNSSGAVARLGNRLIELPVVLRMRRLLESVEHRAR